ncbi:MAG: 1,9-bis(guanidino)-5-aza-nonane synthase [Pseudohongiellaceae bacterium]
MTQAKADKTEQYRAELLSKTVEHIDITSFDARPIIDAMRKMSFTSRDLANAAEMYNDMLADEKCSIILTIAGSTSAGGCMDLYTDLVKHNMVDAIVATGATIVDMDFFEAMGFKHYHGAADMDDRELRDLYIDRIYDTLIDENELQAVDHAIADIADSLPAKSYSSREFIREMGRWCVDNAKKHNSLVETCFKHNVPIFCPAFTDSSAGFGLVVHQDRNPDNHMTLDSIRDFRELTDIKIKAGTTGLLMIGGGVPKNFTQDTVVCAEILGKEVDMHKYAIQITVADSRDGACSSSTLKEACSWGKVDLAREQMVFAEAGSVLPLLASDAWHRGHWKNRKAREFSTLFA